MGEGKMRPLNELVEGLPVIPGLADDIAVCRDIQAQWEAELAASRRSGGGEPEVYPPTGYTGLTSAQAAALGPRDDGHVFKLSDAADAHLKRVGAVYAACQWAPEKAPPFSVHPGGQPREWTPGARFRFTPAPLGEGGGEVGVTLICVVAGADIHRAQVVFRVDGAPAPRSLLIGLWKLATRPEGA